MVKFLFLAALAALGWFGYQRYSRGAFILTDSREENVEKLRTLAAKLNRDAPKEIDAETTLLRVEVTRQGVVNRYKTTAGNAASQFNGDRQGAAFQGLRKDACSDRYWKTTLAHGFSVGYSYVDANSNPLGTFTIRTADCSGT
jgi:hypothetical protein